MAKKIVNKEDKKEDKKEVKPGAPSRELDHLQELLPPGREPIHQGQQFDELQRQHKHPDNTVRPTDPRLDHS
ncbi:MAG: hypothetical protein WA824_12700 [Candidatus Sulfotelmatobacter sp.]